MVKLQGFNKFLAEIAGINDKLEKNVTKALSKSANLVRNDVIKSIQTTSKGYFWAKKDDKKKGKKKRVSNLKKVPKGRWVSKPGDAPNTNTGRLVGSITMEVAENYAEVGTDIEYAWDLEFGSSKNKARPFMTPAAERNRAKIDALIEEAVSEAFK
jgi:HK97 gp10 family phage protein